MMMMMMMMDASMFPWFYDVVDDNDNDNDDDIVHDHQRLCPLPGRKPWSHRIDRWNAPSSGLFSPYISLTTRVLKRTLIPVDGSKKAVVWYEPVNENFSFRQFWCRTLMIDGGCSSLSCTEHWWWWWYSIGTLFAITSCNSEVLCHSLRNSSHPWFSESDSAGTGGHRIWTLTGGFACLCWNSGCWNMGISNSLGVARVSTSAPLGTELSRNHYRCCGAAIRRKNMVSACECSVASKVSGIDFKPCPLPINMYDPVYAVSGAKSQLRQQIATPSRRKWDLPDPSRQCWCQHFSAASWATNRRFANMCALPTDAPKGQCHRACLAPKISGFPLVHSISLFQQIHSALNTCGIVWLKHVKTWVKCQYWRMVSGRGGMQTSSEWLSIVSAHCILYVVNSN